MVDSARNYANVSKELLHHRLLSPVNPAHGLEGLICTVRDLFSGIQSGAIKTGRMLKPPGLLSPGSILWIKTNCKGKSTA